MRQAGRYLPEYRKVRSESATFLELCRSPEQAIEVTLQPLRRFAFDGAILFSDILVLPDALGQSVRFEDGEGPQLTPVRTGEQIATLKQEGLQDRLQFVLDILRGLRLALPDQTTLLGFAGAPWTVACYMVEGGGSKDFSATRTLAYQQPAVFQRLIEILTEATADYLIAQLGAGADAVQLFDSWAGVLPETEFIRWVVTPTRRIVEKLKTAHPDAPVIGFPRGAGPLYQAFADRTGVDAVSLDTALPLSWAVENLPAGVTLQGNLDPFLLVAGGAALDHAIDRILERTAGRPFIFNLGHGILPTTPPEHVRRLVDRVRSRQT
jgi:uroporphyrinogen decarboxylase